jgi:membrane protease YdiL (CAAX protease family)
MTPSVPPPEAPPTIPPPDPEPPTTDEPAWPLWMAPAAIVLGLALGLFTSIVIQIVAQGAGSNVSHPTPAVSIIGDVLFDVAFVAAALYFTRMQGGIRPADFGFRRAPLGLGISAFVTAGIGYYVVTYVYSSLFNLHGSDKLPKELGVSKSTAAAVAVTIFVCVIAPVAEEFFFRGFVFGVLRRWRIDIFGRNIGIWVAAVLTGMLFGLAHTGSASPQYLIPLGFLGFVLCIVRWRTGSLYPCMALHSFNNSLAMGVNQFHWNASEVLGLMAGSMLVIAAVTGPLAERSPRLT